MKKAIILTIFIIISTSAILNWKLYKCFYKYYTQWIDNSALLEAKKADFNNKYISSNDKIIADTINNIGKEDASIYKNDILTVFLSNACTREKVLKKLLDWETQNNFTFIDTLAYLSKMATDDLSTREKTIIFEYLENVPLELNPEEDNDEEFVINGILFMNRIMALAKLKWVSISEYSFYNLLQKGKEYESIVAIEMSMKLEDRYYYMNKKDEILPLLFSSLSSKKLSKIKKKSIEIFIQDFYFENY